MPLRMTLDSQQKLPEDQPTVFGLIRAVSKLLCWELPCRTFLWTPSTPAPGGSRQRMIFCKSSCEGTGIEGFLRTLLGINYEVLKIQLLFLSTPESQLLPEPQGCQHLDSLGSDSFCCQLWKELIWVLPKTLLMFPRFFFILAIFRISLVAGMLGCLTLPHAPAKSLFDC